jgi:uncharacterized protein
MDVTPLVKTGSKIIQSYAGGTFRISGQLYTGPVIVTADQVVAWAAPQEFSELCVENFVSHTPYSLRLGSPSPLREREGAAPKAWEGEGAMDIILLGTGKNFAILPPALRASLKAQGLSVDVMDTGAACRTYNVLLAEGRRVLAALLPV